MVKLPGGESQTPWRNGGAHSNLPANHRRRVLVDPNFRPQTYFGGTPPGYPLNSTGCGGIAGPVSNAAESGPARVLSPQFFAGIAPWP